MNIFVQLCICVWLIFYAVVPHTTFNTVRWQTAHELGLYGFNVERRDDYGAWHTLNAKLISAKHTGEITSARYRYRDVTVQCGTRYEYRIAAIGVDHSVQFSDTMIVASVRCK